MNLCCNQDTGSSFCLQGELCCCNGCIPTGCWWSCALHVFPEERVPELMHSIYPVTSSFPSLLHQLPPCNLGASKLLIVLPHMNSKSLIFMSHPTLPLDRISAVCYLFPLPPLFTIYLHTTGADVFWSVPNDNDCCKIRAIFRTLCLHFRECWGKCFCCRSTLHSILTQCSTT